MATDLLCAPTARQEALVRPEPGAGERDNLPRVLIVDDENGPRQALRMLLKQRFDVAIAENVERALELLAKRPVELVITDIRMPGRSGVELLKEVRKTYPDTQVIMVTGYGQLETAMKAVEFGAFTYMEKPYDNQKMLETIDAALQRARDEANRRAMEKLAFEANRFEMVGRVVSGLMHDLGSPLTVLNSQLEMIAAKQDKADIERRVDTMKSQVQYCNDMVRSTMRFVRHQEQEFALIRVNALIELCMDVAAPLLREDKVTLECEYQEGLPPIEGDIVLLQQALFNLVSNACQAIAETGKPGRLWIRTWESDGSVHVSVEDDGPGVRPELRDRIFQTFFTTKGTKGTGLGLSVVRNVMARHGGMVTFEEAQTGGARFVMTLPAAQGSKNGDGHTRV